MFGRHKIDDVTPAEALRLQQGGAVLLDVREDDEWAAGHASAAVHVALGHLADAAGRFDGQQVLAVCRTGNRSARAAKTLAEAGIDVRNVAGGMASWAAAGLPVLRDDGSPGAVA